MRALISLAMSTAFTLTLTQAGAAEPAPDGTTVTLITGDVVTLSAGGASVDPAPGRERVPMTKFHEDGHLYVVPADAGRLIATDRLDRRLFDVTELVRLGYHDDATIPVITNGRAADVRKGARLATTGKLWLDGVRTLSLDRTVPRIGAPSAWEAGLTGEGVTVAVLDTGVDQTHPDLAGQEVAERNFGDSPDNVDRDGHGTHVASTIAGRGTPYRGVAPGARLLDAKVFDEDGYARDSSIIAALRWAADQGAEVVNLSLGGDDRPGTDPVEAAVEEVSARGVLVVAAAGNSYRPGTIGSPASADAALAVGAVDEADAMAMFSSRGPRHDGAVKPDLVAPGVDVTAAQAGGGHVAMNGTSMAAPHVAGAAALLAQQHPDWTGQRLKAALVGSTTPVEGTEYDRGTGRVDVARGLTQTVTTTPANLGFGVVEWPHTGALEQPLTYHNDGPTEVTLTLSTTGPFTVTPDRVTIPAGDAATVMVHAPGSAEGGPKSGLVTATGVGTRVVTPVSVLHEPKSHTLTIDMVGPDGTPAADYFLKIASLDRQWLDLPYDADGRLTLRLPEGHYVLDTSIASGDAMHLLTAPDLPLTQDTTLTFDARTTRPVAITPPVPAELQLLDFGVATYRPGTRPFYFSTNYSGWRISTGHVGPVAAKGVATTWLNTQWTAGQEFYGLAYFFDGRVPAGFVKKVEDVATVRVRSDLAGPGERWAEPSPRGGFPPVFGGDVTMRVPFPVELPGERVEHYNAEARWATSLTTDELSLRSPSRGYRAGRTYHERFGGAVYGPVLPPTTYPTPGVSRSGDVFDIGVPLFGDAAGNAGQAAPVTLRLYRNGVEVPDEYGWFVVPPEAADYRLTASATREAQVSTAVDVAWTFRSAHVDGTARMPVSVLRFTPALTGDVAPYGRFVVPVTLQRADGSHTRPRHLVVDVSYDEGHTWQRATTHGDKVVLTHPAGARSVSLRASADDRDTTVEQTIIRAYLLR
jgi:subtilisin family serine protease